MTEDDLELTLQEKRRDISARLKLGAKDGRFTITPSGMAYFEDWDTFVVLSAGVD